MGCSFEEASDAGHRLMRIRGVSLLVVFFMQGFLQHAKSLQPDLQLWQGNIWFHGDLLTSHKGPSLAKEEGVLFFEILKPRYGLALRQLYWGS